jgi:PAS domain S-box-containing protein
MVKLRESADELSERERQLRLIADNAPVGIVHLDAELRYKFVNKYHAERLREQYGLAAEQVIGKSVPEVFGDKLFAPVELYLRKCLAGNAVEFEIEQPTRSGEPRFVHCCLEPEWRDDKVVGLVLAGTDITRLKRAEAALRESESQLRLVTDNAPVSIAHLDTEVRYKFINRYHTERHGLTSEQIIGRRVPEVVGEKSFAIVESYIRECLAGKPVEFEGEVPYQGGDPQFVHCRFEPEWRDGKVVGLVSATTNITGLRRAEAALLESEAAFRAMFEVSSVGKVEVEPETGRFLRVNAAMCKFVGYTEAELLSRTVYDITHPDERDRDREPLRRLVAGESDVFDVEKRYIRKDGYTVWARATVNVVRDGSGRALRNTAVVLDITERKECEEKEHLLMREINHRAKNMLSVVHAIAQQTAAQNPKDFVERFSERIQALSANQDLLVRNEWNGVEIKDLVHAQLAHFAELIGTRITVDDLKLRLNPPSAQAIGLALHELATNAGKYGALSSDTGRVDISWSTDGDIFTMSWIERDGPPVSAPEQRGFGAMVMEAMAERSVDGDVDLRYAPSGVTWRLICPAANALER